MLELESAAMDVREELEALQQSHALLQEAAQAQEASPSGVSAAAEGPSVCVDDVVLQEPSTAATAPAAAAQNVGLNSGLDG